MRENEFEKAVNQTLGEFRVSPSAGVWDEVERRIRKRKKRRILIFWFLFTGFVAAGLLAWWILPVDRKQEKMIITGKPGRTKPATYTGPASHTPATQQAAPAPAAKQEVTPALAVAGDNKPVNGLKPTSATGAIAVKDKQLRITVKKSGMLPVNSNSRKPEISASEVKQATVQKEKPDYAELIQAQQPMQEISGKNSGIVPVQAVVPDTLPAASNPQAHAPAAAIPGTAGTIPEADKDSTPLQPVKTVRNPKWETGILVAAGRSRLTEGGFRLFAQHNFDALASGGVVNNPPPAGGLSYADSLPLTGPAFQLGVYAKRRLGKKTAFSAGIQLGYYAGRQRVGAYVDSLRFSSTVFSNVQTYNGFYRLGGTGHYMNRYYFLQVPLLFHWQLNKGEKIPLSWENGLLPSVLIASKALVYDLQNGFFFRDQAAYTTFSLAARTAFSAEFFGTQKRPLTASLFYGYHFSRLQRTGSPRFNFLSNYGLLFRIRLNK